MSDKATHIVRLPAWVGDEYEFTAKGFRLNRMSLAWGLAYVCWCTLAAAFFEESYRILLVAGLPLAFVGSRLKVRALQEARRIGGPSTDVLAATIPVRLFGRSIDEYRVTSRGAQLLWVFRVLAIAVVIDFVAMLALRDDEMVMTASLGFFGLLVPALLWLNRLLSREMVRIA